ncbi:MAG: hypothetical protein KBH41_06230, partial [Azonexus sp.]|nr:hypothetical protein [Azonexus sp.]
MAAYPDHMNKKNPARAGFLLKRDVLLGADDFDVSAAIRLQALDEGLGLDIALALVAGDRLGL